MTAPDDGGRGTPVMDDAPPPGTSEATGAGTGDAPEVIPDPETLQPMEAPAGAAPAPTAPPDMLGQEPDAPAPDAPAEPGLEPPDDLQGPPS